MSKRAQIAYQAYGSVTDFKNYQGNPMPEWKDLPPTIQEAWKKAAEANTPTPFDRLEMSEQLINNWLRDTQRLPITLQIAKLGFYIIEALQTAYEIGLTEHE